uniref:Uncharacterized protein n=1 Tax=viral metagenome TaxID=1070528 RepID=A0A6C0K621_9ZZZZ
MSFPENIEFPARYMTYREFFDINNLFDEKYLEYKFIVSGNGGVSNKNGRIKELVLSYDDNNILRIFEKEISNNKTDVTDKIIYIYGTPITNSRGDAEANIVYSTIVELIIINNQTERKEYKRDTEYSDKEREYYGSAFSVNEYNKYKDDGITGGRKASVKKEICGRLRSIYKIQGSRKEHIKYKGRLITVADYKRLMKKA